MKIFKYLVALVAVALFSLNTSVAQSVSPGFSDLLIFDGTAHVIRPNSITYNISVDDLGNESALLRRVSYRPNQNSPWQEMLDLFAYVNLGIDSFDVHVPGGGTWGVKVDYLLESDPNVVVETFESLFQAKASPDPVIDGQPFGFLNGGGIFTYGFETGRYINSTSPRYDAHHAFNLRSVDLGGIIVRSDTVLVNPAGSGWINSDRSVAMYNYPAGYYCVDLTVLYSHDGPGFQDFAFVTVGQSEIGLNCFYWEGISTSVVDTVSADETITISILNGQVVVEGAPSDATTEIYDTVGQEVGSFSASEAYQTRLTPGVYIVHVRDSRQTLIVQKVYIGE